MNSLTQNLQKTKENLTTMRSSKKLSEIVGKWRKRRKGHFVVYAREGKRFVVPLHYLNHPIFRVLLEMAEEEFGSTVHGPLRVPCEEELMDYIVTLLRKNWHLDSVEKLKPLFL